MAHNFRNAGIAGLSIAVLCGAAQSPPAADAAKTTSASSLKRANFRTETTSRDAQRLADWVLVNADNKALPFIVIDKVAAKAYVFYNTGLLRGAAPVLLGLARGDDSVPGIGERRLATIKDSERTTPAGRFEAALGHDFDQDILWVDYASALSLHRVIVGNPKDRRHARLASPTPLDNRVSYGCINVPVSFYNNIVEPIFRNTVGIVYILPETKSLEEVFPIGLRRPFRPGD